MNKTALKVIKKGLRELGILQTQEEPTADAAQDGLEVLNSMLQAWELDGIRLNHTDLILTDTLPYPENHYLPIVYNFAAEYANEYGVDVSLALASKAGNGYRNLQNYYFDPVSMTFDTAINSNYAPNRYFR